MASEYFVAAKEVQDLAWALIASNHADLAGTLDAGDLVVVFKAKAESAKPGGQVTLVTARKAPPLTNALAGEHYKFILELPQGEWEEMSATQREANLDHLLCACRASSNQKTGDVKFSIAKPDVSAYRENVERYGMWFPKDEDDPKDGSDKDDEDDIGKLLGVGSGDN